MTINFHKSVPDTVQTHYHHIGTMLSRVKNPHIKWPKYVMQPLEEAKRTGKITEKQVQRIQNKVYQVLQDEKAQSDKPKPVKAKSKKARPSSKSTGSCGDITLSCSRGHRNRRFVTINGKTVYIE